MKEITSRLRFLKDVGLSYLTLSRASGTLSGGESQRIRLATQIGSSLMGVLYILDEPSIGLHQRDNDKLLGTLKQLRDLGNTLRILLWMWGPVRAAMAVKSWQRERWRKSSAVPNPLPGSTCPVSRKSRCPPGAGRETEKSWRFGALRKTI